MNYSHEICTPLACKCLEQGKVPRAIKLIPGFHVMSKIQVGGIQLKTQYLEFVVLAANMCNIVSTAYSCAA